MYRFAVIPYANAMPLGHFIPRICPDSEIRYRKPVQGLRELLGGRVDAAILPIVDCFEEPGIRSVEGLGICANGAVQSVLLRCNCPLETIRTVRLDPASRTSNLLVRVLMAEHFHASREIIYGFDIENADAGVCIGDRALTALPAFETYDLAAEWKNMTGLPFVFAVWAYKRKRSDGPAISDILFRAKQMGCDALAEIASFCSKRLNLPYEKCRSYLTERLYYDLGPREYESIEVFRGLSGKCPVSRIVAIPVAGGKKRKDWNVSLSK